MQQSRSQLLTRSGHKLPQSHFFLPGAPIKPFQPSSPDNFFPWCKLSCFTTCYGYARGHLCGPLGQRGLSKIQVNSLLQSLRAKHTSEADVHSFSLLESKTSLPWWQVCSFPIPATWEISPSGDFRTKSSPLEPSKQMYPCSTLWPA